VRYEGPYATVLGGLLLGSAAATIGGGLYLRSLEVNRHRETEQVRQDERLAIARELHDVVAHHVTGIVVQAQAARLVGDSRPDAVVDALADIERAGSEAMVAMRHLVGSLRAEHDAAPLTPAATLREVHELVDATRRAGVPVELALELDGTSLPAELAASVHRIVQESLTNVRRHARHVSLVQVLVGQVRDEVRIVVADDGERSGRRGSGFGVAGMTERAEALGGRLAAGPRPERGWAVTAVLPLPSHEII
jgi:signal transduction histidine kinase